MYCVLDFPLILTRIIAVTLCLITAYVSGVAEITERPSNIYATVGDNVSIVWNYTVTNRNNEFTGSSPTWSYNSKQIAYEDKYDSWKWKIETSTCPERFVSPKIRIFKKDVATLVITNVSLEDNGTYWFELDIQVGTNPKSFMNLFVVTPTTAPPTTQPILPGKPVLQLHPDNPVFCQGDTINITSKGVTGNPTLTNLTFLQNDSSIGMLNVTTSGNYTKAFSHALTQPGALTFSCKATNDVGSSTSNVVTITVKAAPTPTKTPTSGLNIGAIIAGSVCGGLVLCGACTGGGCYCYKKYKKSSGQNCGNSDVALKNKVDKEGNDNTQPTA